MRAKRISKSILSLTAVLCLLLSAWTCPMTTITAEEPLPETTEVKIAWEITDISASVSAVEIWDPVKLTWISEATVQANDGTATFEFENLSSGSLSAKVTFDPEDGITADPSFRDNDASTENSDGEIVLQPKGTEGATGTIAVTVPPDEDFLAEKTESAVDQTYGRYTITVSELIP